MSETSDLPDDHLPHPSARCYTDYEHNLLVIALKWVRPGYTDVVTVKIPRDLFRASRCYPLDLVTRELELKLRDGTARGERLWASIDPLTFAAAIHRDLPALRPEQKRAREAEIALFLGTPPVAATRAYECVGGPFDGESRQLPAGHTALDYTRLDEPAGGVQWTAPDFLEEPPAPKIVRGRYLVATHARLGVNLVWCGEA